MKEKETTNFTFVHVCFTMQKSLLYKYCMLLAIQQFIECHLTHFQPMGYLLTNALFYIPLFFTFILIVRCGKSLKCLFILIYRKFL